MEMHILVTLELAINEFQSTNCCLLCSLKKHVFGNIREIVFPGNNLVIVIIILITCTIH